MCIARMCCLAGVPGSVRDREERGVPSARELGAGAVPGRPHLPAVAVLRPLRRRVPHCLRRGRHPRPPILRLRHPGHLHLLLLPAQPPGRRRGIATSPPPAGYIVFIINLSYILKTLDINGSYLGCIS